MGRQIHCGGGGTAAEPHAFVAEAGRLPKNLGDKDGAGSHTRGVAVSMEFLALFAVGLAAIIGFVICRAWLGGVIASEDRVYFAPAIGLGACGIVAYFALHTRLPWLILVFAGAGVLCFGIGLARAQRRTLGADSWRLARFAIGAVFCLYGMQIALYGLFSRVYPGPHEVWSLFNLSGVSPPDQMFAWHQAMFADQHRHYPQDAFYDDMDLYDRPHLGGYITLFFFKLFHLPLTEEKFVYPAGALRFYHCFWWLLNNLYLLGVAPLFHRLFGLRGAVLAVSSTAFGGFFILCNLGGWMKFSSAYPFLLAMALFLDGKAPVLQAALCAMSYYIHGSVLPFLAGFGALQIVRVYHPLAGRRSTFKDLAWFSSIGAVLVGAWFVTVRWVGSKQPLFYYYLYDAELTEAQTRPVAEIAKAFYANHSWPWLSWLPVQNLGKSFLPTSLYDFLQAWIWNNAPARLSDFATNIFAAQRFGIACALGVVAAPAVIAGFIKSLARKDSGKVALCLYLVPTLMIAVIYRKEWAFSLHVITLYHTLVLFLWAEALRRAPLRYVAAALLAIALEGILCVLFADGRFLPVNGLRLDKLSAAHAGWLIAYLALAGALLAATCIELKQLTRTEPAAPTSPSVMRFRAWAVSGQKAIAGVLIGGAVIGAYALYCRRFY